MDAFFDGDPDCEGRVDLFGIRPPGSLGAWVYPVEYAHQSQGCHALALFRGSRSQGFCITPWDYALARFYPDMCLNGVNTQWVYSHNVIQKTLRVVPASDNSTVGGSMVPIDVLPLSGRLGWFGGGAMRCRCIVLAAWLYNA